MKFRGLDIAVRKGSARIAFADAPFDNLAGVIAVQEGLVAWAREQLVEA